MVSTTLWKAERRLCGEKWECLFFLFRSHRLISVYGSYLHTRSSTTTVDINIKSVCKNVFNFPRAKRDSLLSSARPFFPFFYGVSSLVELLAFLFFSQRQCAARPPVDTKLLSQKPPKMNEKKVFYETRDKLLWWQRKATILGCAKQSQ